MTIGQRLRALRVATTRWAGEGPTLEVIASGLTTKEKRIDVSQVSRWERDEAQVPSSLLPQWLDLLKATPGERADLLATPPADVSQR